MRVAVLHNAVRDDAAPDDLDVLVQAEAVSEALASLRHEPVRVPCTLDLASLKDRLGALAPDVVFNLVESLGGEGRLIHVAAGLLEAMQLPFTGCSAEALFLSSHKVLAKERLVAHELPTPPWRTLTGAAGPGWAGRGAGARCIVKSIWEDASLGLTDESVIDAADRTVIGALRARAGLAGAPWFAELFIDGREINLSVLDGPDGPEVLPPAEIVFEGYPDGKPRIVGYPAKWEPESFEYRNTPRTFSFAKADGPLIGRLRGMALAAWDLFRMRGYGRVDFRVDGAGRPWILEVNANPCLSPDAGLCAAMEAAGLSYREGVRRILAKAQEADNRADEREEN